MRKYFISGFFAICTRGDHLPNAAMMQSFWSQQFVLLLTLLSKHKFNWRSARRTADVVRQQHIILPKGGMFIFSEQPGFKWWGGMKNVTSPLAPQAILALFSTSVWAVKLVSGFFFCLMQPFQKGMLSFLCFHRAEIFFTQCFLKDIAKSHHYWNIPRKLQGNAPSRHFSYYSKKVDFTTPKSILKCDSNFISVK